MSISPTERAVLAHLDDWTTRDGLRSTPLPATWTIGRRLDEKLGELRARGLVEQRETAIGTMYRRRSRKPVATRSDSPQAKSMRRLREQRRSAGLCWECDRPVMPGHARCQDHVEKRRVARKADGQEQKEHP